MSVPYQYEFALTEVYQFIYALAIMFICEIASTLESWLICFVDRETSQAIQLLYTVPCGKRGQDLWTCGPLLILWWLVVNVLSCGIPQHHDASSIRASARFVGTALSYIQSAGLKT